jgi:hypothetical protein
MPVAEHADNLIATRAGEPAVPPNRTASRKIAVHRPRCGGCGDMTRLCRIAPTNDGAAFKVEYTSECECGTAVVISEADLAQSPLSPPPTRVALPEEI